MRNMKTKMLLLMLGLLILPVVYAQGSDTDTVTVRVTVAPATYVDISPDEITWTNVNPGQGPEEYPDLINYTFEIENVGSNNITRIEAWNTVPSENPFASGVPTKYVATNFLVIDLNESNLAAFQASAPRRFRYAVRREYNDSTTWELRYLELPGGVTSVGRFRLDNNEFFWAIVPNSTGGCGVNGTANDGPKIYLGETPHNYTDLGDVDLTDNYVDIGTLVSYEEYGYSCVDVTSFTTAPAELDEYMIYISPDCSYVELVEWYVSRDSNDHCLADEYLWSKIAGDGDLEPGDSFSVDLAIRVPWGVVEGSVTPGTLTIKAYAS
jgi:hypothetical protein